jgi:hypothetical protein
MLSNSNLAVITDCDPLDIEKIELGKKIDKKDYNGLLAAGCLFSVATILGISNSGSSTSLWGIAWKTLAFAGLCALGHQFRKTSEDRESIRNAVKEMASSSQVDESKPLIVFINYQDPPGLLPSLFYDVSYKEQIEKLSKIAKVHILEPLNELTLTNLLSHFKSKSIKTMCIRSHADQSEMEIAPELILSAKHTNILNAIHDKMAKDSHIILLGCCTGKGEENISKEISLVCTDSIIYGASDYAHLIGTQINVDGSNKIVYFSAGGSSEGIKVHKIENLTRKYFNGLLID